ncbi:methylenetetrahydrofolate--tRNA-(uracil(54)-C(5))-methyltransferase (FADH(2)-oxidizing) TrmFO [Allisonella histaminiformans]|uniref:methylenetetrahydrofolate--tRNA-(uracil(54)- C(5))-methyltransferase (FADH(2)-oxidizing) TrmFO n=1 Tax=Allisonella histaminiformans TaxID=209880 RepID=UPI002E79B680|nr:methylenetetrahydrofolate--tRNA-(uracil(54)-C(5))-methyltransferase (FADH(2)-oxidizing) TrmFO [Allisonella histaminiformans]
MTEKVIVVGAGLAGSEAAWQLAQHGIPVRLVEMRPVKQTPAHHTELFAELVCSNSLRAAAITNAVGLLKEEMRRMDSVIMRAADTHQVPAGGALAVDREGYAREVTRLVSEHPLVEVVHEELTEIPREGLVIIATGPLTEGKLGEDIQQFCGGEGFHFYDAAAPIVTEESMDLSVVYKASRYGKGKAAYLNCPMNEEEYHAFREALIHAETAEVHGFENGKVFEGCMPIEVMAARGEDTMRFGPLKPVGLPLPGTDKEPYAVVQLRQDNEEGTQYNIVGFQTHLKWGEQRRVFGMIPGLKNAEFVRYGVMHRNTYIDSPDLLNATLEARKRQGLFFAGQMTGVEGYVESAASGIVAAWSVMARIHGVEPEAFPKETAMGALMWYISHYDGKNFQPMNVNFGLIPSLAKRVPKKEKNQKLAERALHSLTQFIADYSESIKNA